MDGSYSFDSPDQINTVIKIHHFFLQQYDFKMKIRTNHDGEKYYFRNFPTLTKYRSSKKIGKIVTLKRS